MKEALGCGDRTEQRRAESGENANHNHQRGIQNGFSSPGDILQGLRCRKSRLQEYCVTFCAKWGLTLINAALPLNNADLPALPNIGPSPGATLLQTTATRCVAHRR
jgi:hypothetical protein